MNEMRKIMEAIENIAEQNIVHRDPESILGNTEAEQEQGYDFISANYRTVGWKANPDEVLEEIAVDLENFGLGIEMVNLGNDQYYFRVVKRSQ